jgi:KDO2-lipid IV(A) lauroyltransferase
VAEARSTIGRRTGSGWFGRALLTGLRGAELLATAALVPLALPLALLPEGPARTLGRVYGEVAWAFWPSARRVAMINLRRAMGMDRAPCRWASREVLRELSSGVAEGVRFAWRHRRPGSGWEETFQAEDPELHRRILDDPRPRVFVTAHLGSWEVLHMLMARRFGARGAAIVRRVDNPFLDPLIRRLRVSDPGQWIEKRGGSREALARLRRGDSVSLLLDEDAGRKGLFVDFFGRPASTQPTAALLSLIAEAPLVVGVLVRRPERPVLRLELIEPSAFRSRSEPVAALTQAATAVLERWIRDDPWQWRWIHWRWKHRPDGTVERYDRRSLAGCFR